MINLPFGLDINNLIDDLRIFSWEAADILMLYSSNIKKQTNHEGVIVSKDKNEPVTMADLKVNELIINGINKKYNYCDWEILSEENVKINPNNSNPNSDWLWVLDPLDGTKDFIQGTGNYAMHLALNHKDKPYLGIVLIPEKNELWISNGKKLWCERRDGSIKKTNISKNTDLNEMILVTSKNHGNPTLDKLIKKIKFKEVINMGSIGCKVASILRGESDVYITLSLKGKTAPKDWDFAAPEAILKAGGGAITNLETENLIYNKKNFEQRGIIIATKNKMIHKVICSQIKEIIGEFLI